MAGLLYYLPGRGAETVSLADMGPAGIGYAFEKRFTARGCSGGPDDGGGVIVADDGGVKRVGYYPKEQSWREMPLPVEPAGEIAGPRGKPWVGFFNDAKPTPAELARERQLQGHWVTLGDGQSWLIPVARGAADSDSEQMCWYNALPKRVDVNEQGEWESGGVIDRYRSLWDTATRWWDAVSEAFSGEDAESEEKVRVTFDFDGLNEAALCALAANYRVNRIEVAVLGLFAGECATEILNALVDWPTIAKWLEKKTTEMGKASTPAG